MPPLAGCVRTVLVLVCVPPPQVAEHVLHSLQSDVWQLTGHTCVLQLWIWVSGPHGSPPYCAGVTTVRVLVWNPPPHGWLHADQSLHDDI